MKKEYRIKKTQEFQTILNKKQFASCASVVVYASKKSLDYSRFGISVSKKMGNAVIRNKIKRQLRMMLQDIDPHLNTFDAIIIARNKFNVQNYEQNKKDLEMCFKKVKIR